ncbi:MAG TPA: ATP-binding protein [Blastocatellia bacterium]|nr:ATP-binding protein [Blastocatellia bacterium]
MRVRNFSQKLTLSFAAVSLFGVALAVIALVFLRNSSPAESGGNQIARLARIILAERLRIDETIKSRVFHQGANQGKDSKSVDSSYETLKSVYDATRQLTSDQMLIGMLDELQKGDEEALRPLEARIFQAVARQDFATAQQIYSSEYLRARDAYQRWLDSFGEITHQVAGANVDGRETTRSLIYSVIIALLLGMLTAAGLLSTYLTRSFRLPIKSLMYVARSISAGELKHTLSLNRKDEFGEMAESLNLMVTNLRKMNEDLTEQVKRLRETRSELHETQNQLVIQEQMMQQEKMAALGRLVAGVAHELNNPISFVYSNTVLLGKSIADLRRLLDLYDTCEGIPAAAEHKIDKLKKEIDYEYLINDLSSAIEDCHEGSRRVRDIVLNLKTLSRADESQCQKVDIATGIDSTLRLLGQLFRGRINVHRDYGVVPEIDCYAGQISQVWMNLLVNAAQAMNEQGDVWISIRVEGAYAVIKFRDNGPGIPDELITRIFDPFFTTKPVGEGTGLGLSIVHGIIERHGGDIRVESTVGVGTTFTVRLPLAGVTGMDMRSEEHEGALVS